MEHTRRLSPAPAAAATAITLIVLTAGATAAGAAVLRVGNWNVGNQPNDAAQAANLRTVVDHVGALGADARPLDILALAETYAGSAVDTVGVFDALYGGGYAAATASADAGGDRTGFVYNTNTVALLAAAGLSSGLTHPALRGRFRPAGTTGAADFYVYAIHLKSGDASADEDARLAEAQAIRADADALGPARHLRRGLQLDRLGRAGCGPDAQRVGRVHQRRRGPGVRPGQRPGCSRRR